ncbi:MAG: hypothetical protein ACQ9MH_14025 [Nitrospinales bacterium]
MKPTEKFLTGLDEIFQNYSVGELVVGLEWDSWSGYTVVLKTIESEHLTKDITNFINIHYNQLNH